MMTGREVATVRADALKAGACEFLVKPFDDEVFLTAVREALGAAPSDAGPDGSETLN